MGTPPDPTYDEFPPLSSSASKRLRDGLKPQLAGYPDAAEDFIQYACYAVAHFCDYEPRFRDASIKEIKKKLRRLKYDAYKFSRTLRAMTPETLQELALDWWCNIEPLPDPSLPDYQRICEVAHRVRVPVPAEGYQSSTYTVATLLLELERIQDEIDKTLKPSIKIIEGTTKRSGRVRRQGWYNLAYDLARSYKHHFNYLPSTRPDGTFEMMFSACLKVGLTELGTPTAFPDSLHQYVLDAVKSIRGLQKIPIPN